MGAMFIITIITTLKTTKTFILCQLFSFLNRLKMMNSLFFSSNSKQNATNYELSQLQKQKHGVNLIKSVCIHFKLNNTLSITTQNLIKSIQPSVIFFSKKIMLYVNRQFFHKSCVCTREWAPSKSEGPDQSMCGVNARALLSCHRLGEMTHRSMYDTQTL